MTDRTTLIARTLSRAAARRVFPDSPHRAEQIAAAWESVYVPDAMQVLAVLDAEKEREAR